MTATPQKIQSLRLPPTSTPERLLGTPHDCVINPSSRKFVPPIAKKVVTPVHQLSPSRTFAKPGRRSLPHSLKEQSVPSEPPIGIPTDKIAARHRDHELIGLVEQIARGDEQALAALYDHTNRLVYGLILRILGDQGAAEEVLLDVYTQVWRQAPNYDVGRGSPMAWLTTIARSRAIDRLRSGWQTQQRQEPLDVVNDKETQAFNPEENSVFAERQRLVIQALAALNAEQREVIELAYYGGLSHSEIAERLQQPLGTVKTRTRLAMMKLRDALTPLLSDNAIAR
jgi:RNA polymerase sigma-70 factor (ECF subfamily)